MGLFGGTKRKYLEACLHRVRRRTRRLFQTLMKTRVSKTMFIQIKR